jgi:hypothetical protein
MAGEHADPTPLARCKVAADAAHPLVTEWPASEKAHLETLAATQTVAVAFSGCEMKIVDGCKLPGNYAWHRTTPSSDVVEVTNADELFAKLPLGAFSLEGELERTGRLAVRTTVAGQLRAGEVDTRNLPRDGPCGEVTHFVSAISVGAFTLLSGGSIRVQASGSVTGIGVGAGGATKQEEKIVRESGDVGACKLATDQKPDPACGSPIQVFLQPVNRTMTEVEKKSAADEQTAKGAGVQMVFSPPESGGVWSLRDGQDNLVCKLPCTRWVTPGSGYHLRKEEARASDHRSIAIPDALPFDVGSTARATVEPARGNRWLAGGSFLLSTAVLATGIVFFFEPKYCQYDKAAGDNYESRNGPSGTSIFPFKSCPKTESYPAWNYQQPQVEQQGTLQSDKAPMSYPLGIAMMVAGVVGMGLSAYWFAWSHGDRVDFSSPAGAKGSASRAPSTQLVVLPGFVGGTF